MRVLIVLFFFFLSLFNFSNAQKQNSKLSTEILFGMSIPVGKFATNAVNTYPTQTGLGSAKAGPTTQLLFNYDIEKSFGASLLIGWQQNGQDGSILKDSLVSRYPEYNHYNVNMNPWKLWKIMAGGFAEIPLAENKFYIEPKLFAGLLKTSVPGYSYSIYNNQSTISGPPPQGGHTSGPSFPWSVCYQFNVAIKWHYSSPIFFSLNTAYFHSTPVRKYTFYTNPPSGGGTSYQTKYPISSCNILVGVGYRF